MNLGKFASMGSESFCHQNRLDAPSQASFWNQKDNHMVFQCARAAEQQIIGSALYAEKKLTCRRDNYQKRLRIFDNVRDDRAQQMAARARSAIDLRGRNHHPYYPKML